MVGLLALGLFAPAATPKAIIDQITGATHKAMTDPEFQQVFAKAGLEPIPDSDSANARKFLEEEAVRWGPVVKAAGLKTQ